MTSDPTSVLKKMRAVYPETPETVYAAKAKQMAFDRATIKRAINLSKQTEQVQDPLSEQTSKQNEDFMLRIAKAEQARKIKGI